MAVRLSKKSDKKNSYLQFDSNFDINTPKEAVQKVIQNYYQLTNCKCIPYFFRAASPTRSRFGRARKAQLNSAQGVAFECSKPASYASFSTTNKALVQL